MANVTLTTTTANYDEAALLTLGNGEQITINGSNVIINSDSRWGQNAAVVGNLVISSTFGGSILLDGRDVWWMAFDAATGNVPALGTCGTNDTTGGVAGAGEFLGVFTALGVAPSAAGGAMPATGFIKFRKVTTAFVDNEVMTFAGGATATVNSATGGVRGWIHVVGGETATHTIPKLGTFTAIGSDFILGMTDGTDDQTFQFPVTDACPAIQIETAAGSGVYEWWLNSGDRWGTATQFVSTDVRGKYFGMVNSTGVITIARRATNACGYKPATGLRVRIPNIICSNSTSANWALNTINTTITSRVEFNALSGNLDIQNCCMNWFLNLLTPYYFNIEKCAILQAIVITSTGIAFNIDDCGIGLTSTTDFDPISINGGFEGGVISKVRMARYVSVGLHVIAISDSVGISLIDCQFEIFGSLTAVTRNSAGSNAISLARCSDIIITNPICIGARIVLSTCRNLVMTNLQHADQLNGDTTSTTPQAMLSITTNCNGITVDGISSFAGLANQHPYSNLLTITTSTDVEVRNIGTPTAKYNCGSANQTGFIVSMATNDNVRLRRIYVQNIRTIATAISVAVSCNNLLFENVWCDITSTATFNSLNTLVKGCMWLNTTTGQNAIYGTHWFDNFKSATVGELFFSMNESSADTAALVVITAGTPKFMAVGSISMPTINDQVIFTMPYWCLGHTSFANIAATLTGTLTGNMTYDYQLDTGSGYGAYKTLSAANLSGETISPTVGFKLRIKITANATHSSTVLRNIIIPTVTDATNQQIQYPNPDDAIIAVTNILTGSRLQLYNVTTATELANEIITGTTFDFSYLTGGGEIDLGDSIRLRLTYQSGVTAKLGYESFSVASATGSETFATQLADDVYILNAIDGSTITELSADYPNIQIDSTDGDGATNVKTIYAWFVYNLTTSDGIADMFGAILAEDEINYKVKTALVNLKIDNTIATPLHITGGRIYRDNGTTIIAAASNSIQIEPDKAYLLSGTGGTGATAAEIRTELAVELARIDVATSTRNSVAPDNASITAIKAKTDQLVFTSGNVNAIAQVVSDKTGYALTSGERTAIAVAIEAALLSELDGQAVLAAIVAAIGNTNVNEIALVAAIRSDIERVGGSIDLIQANTNLIPAVV